MPPTTVFDNIWDFPPNMYIFNDKYQKHVHSNRSVERSRWDMDLIFTAIERAHTGASF